MAGIVEPLRPTRVLSRPKRFTPLKSFSCGRTGRPWEKMVNEWADLLYRGLTPEAEATVVLEDATGRLIGFCTFRPQKLEVRGGKLAGVTQRIHVLATDRHCRGTRLEDGSRLGDVLLRGALEHIKAACNGRMPVVSALVTPENDRSRALFDRNGFRPLKYSGEGEIIFVHTPIKLPFGLRRSSTRDRQRIAPHSHGEGALHE